MPQKGTLERAPQKRRKLVVNVNVNKVLSNSATRTADRLL